MQIEDLKAYKILEKRYLKDMDSESYILKHIKTGARIALLSNNDENKVFYIGFRTPPKDSTGVAHIIEHTVLCGSRDFPVKDPFIELAKGSLNTFLNAMTYPDKTVYPVASCNDKDFQNLMHVYLDAVFYPNIYQTEKIFMQEGWHYEMEDEQSDLSINGVVYNEMKGAFSSPDDVLDRQIMNSLFPDTTYGIESGGDPDDIPNLTYEQYLDFHRKYYHPSNSYIYLYGNMDMVEKLQYIDENYLSNYDDQPVDSAVSSQPSFVKMKEIHKDYSVIDEESEENGTYLAYNCCLSNSLDKKMYIAFDVLDYALCSAQGAVLKKALIDKGIGEDVYSEYENGIKQPFFSIVAKNASSDQKEEFILTIRSCLEKVVKDGLDKKTLLAALSNDEFKFREADFGRFPKGLLYGLQVLDSWLYDDMKPWIHLEAGDTFTELKKDVDGHYFEDLIQKYLLDNTHSTMLLLEPKKGLSSIKDDELKAKLLKYKNSLSKEEILQIVKNTADLKAYQDAPDDPQKLRLIPLLERKDMKKEADPVKNELRDAAGTKILFHDIFTNGIGYITFVFDIKSVPKELFPYLGIFKTVLGLVDTKNYGYGELNNEINIRTGGISGSVSTYFNAKQTDNYRETLEISVKVLKSNIKDGFELVHEILMNSIYSDTKRIKAILDEKKSHMQASLESAGHQAAALRAESYFSKTAALNETVNGIECYSLVQKLCSSYDAETGRKLGEIFDKLSEIIFRKENLFVDYTTPNKDYDGFDEEVKEFSNNLFTCETEKGEHEAALLKKNEGFITAGQVQYVCSAGNFRNKGLEYTGALKVLHVMMGYDYLWTNIRVRGGAYGCMSSFSRSGDSFFVTYRDPHLKRSVDVFNETSKYLRSFEVDERTMTQYIIGAIGELDTPKTPSAKGSYAMTLYMHDISFDDVQKSRDELLSTTVETIHILADYVDAFLSDDCLCVVGSSNKIESDKQLFKETKQLVNS